MSTAYGRQGVEVAGEPQGWGLRIASKMAVQLQPGGIFYETGDNPTGSPSKILSGGDSQPSSRGAVAGTQFGVAGACVGEIAGVPTSVCPISNKATVERGPTAVPRVSTCGGKGRRNVSPSVPEPGAFHPKPASEHVCVSKTDCTLLP